MSYEDGARNIGERRRYEDKIEVVLNSIPSEVKELRHDLARNELETNDIRTEIRGLVLAWNTASSVAMFLKWLTAVLSFTHFSLVECSSSSYATVAKKRGK